MKSRPLIIAAIILSSLAFSITSCKKDMSMKMNNPHNIHGVTSYSRTFGDLNPVQVEVAQAIGIKPIADVEGATDLDDRLVLVEDCDNYAVDELTHSIPYLIPGAARLIDDIGANFLDSLENKGLNPYRIIVTSVTRTLDNVKQLRRSNGNSTENSAHYYGTTFDLSWRRFQKVEDPDGRPLQDVSSDTLKLVLAEVLRDVRKAERCYIKYERKQGCFHITSREK